MKRILEELKNYSLYISSIEKINGGINSKVFKAKDSKGIYYAIKIYKEPNFTDKRQRRINEASFYEYIEKCDVKCIPQLVSTSEKNNFGIYSWIDGEKITNPTTEDLQQIVDFIIAINNYDCRSKHTRSLPFASDAYKTSLSPAIELRKRMEKYIKKCESNSALGSNSLGIISNEIFRATKEALNRYMKNLSEEIWGENYRPSYVSPSDIGFHNMIKSKSTIHFFDFEYGGMDDISKMVADLTCNPNYKFSNHEENCILKLITNKNIVSSNLHKLIDDHWIDRYKSIKRLVELKWCYIMLNTINMKCIELEEKKIRSYYDKISPYFIT